MFLVVDHWIRRKLKFSAKLNPIKILLYRGVEVDATLLPKVKLEVVVSKIPVDAVIEATKKALYTGHIGDGKVFVYSVDKVVKIRTGEENEAALQDVE